MRRSWCALLVLITCMALPACVVTGGPYYNRGYYRNGYGYRPYGGWGYGRTVVVDRYPDIDIDRPEAVPLPEAPPPMPEAMPMPDMGMPDFGPGDMGGFDLGDF